MLSYCIKDSQSDKIYYGVIDKKDIDTFPPDKTDKRIVKQCIEDMMQFDRLVAHYGIRFDFPFLRTRALYNNLKFPSFGELFISDTWVFAKKKLKLNSNRLETIARTLLGKTNKTHLEYKYWIAGTRGDKKALDYVLKHNKADVIDLEKIYNKLVSFSRKTETSI